MSIESAMTDFVLPMRRRFTVPNGIDQQGFMEDLAEAVAAYPREQLAGAATWFRDNREARAFPTIAECKRACERTPTVEHRATERLILKSREQQDAERRVESQREIAAWKLCRCAMGRQADREGWLVALIEHCQDHGMLPEGRDIDRVKDAARRSEEALAALKPAWPESGRADDRYRQALGFYEACAAWRRLMIQRAHDRVFGWIEQQQSTEGHIRPQQAA